MSFYRNRVYPSLVGHLGDPRPIQSIRRQLIPRAEGTVLEIGVGAGANFIHYDTTRVRKLYALEPNAGMIRLAKMQQRRTALDVEYVNLAGERLSLDGSTVDTVVTTFTLCTISNLTDALRGVHHVLRPGGTLVFFELGLSSDPAVQRWQRRLEPLFCRLFDGLHLTRDMPALLHHHGFSIRDIAAGYLARFPKAPSFCWWGTAERIDGTPQQPGL